MTYREENLIEIAWIHQQLCSSNSYRNTDFDSRDAKEEIIALADLFEQEYEGVDWDSGQVDYFEEIDQFATDMLMEWNLTGITHINMINQFKDGDRVKLISVPDCMPEDLGRIGTVKKTWKDSWGRKNVDVVLDGEDGASVVFEEQLVLVD